MSEAMSFIEDARKSFRLASTAQEPDEMERYVKMGREYIQLARTAAKVVVGGHVPESLAEAMT